MQFVHRFKTERVCQSSSRRGARRTQFVFYIIVIDSIHKIKIRFSEGFQMLTNACECSHVV
jgi:hypothetical protein